MQRGIVSTMRRVSQWRSALKFFTIASVKMDTLDRGATTKISMDLTWVSFNDENDWLAWN